MGMPRFTYKTGPTRKGGDPNAIKSFSTGGTPRRIVKKRRRGNTEVGDVGAWLGTIFLLIPMLGFLIYLLPKFFFGLAVIIACFIGVKKLNP